MNKLEIFKKNLAKYALVGTLLVTGVSLTGCKQTAEKEPSNKVLSNKELSNKELSYIEAFAEANDISNIEITEYVNKEEGVKLTPLNSADYDTINKDIIADIKIENEDNQTKGTIYTYFCYGYQASKKCVSIQEAMDIDEKFHNNSMFIEGFEQQKRDTSSTYAPVEEDLQDLDGEKTPTTDEIFIKAKAENRQYIEITVETDQTKQVSYYPVEELTVISYEDDCHAIVRNYDEQIAKTAAYQDLLGKDMTSYAGLKYQTLSLLNFTNNHIAEIPDADYILVGNKNYIPQISNKTFLNKEAVLAEKKTK